MKVGGDIPWAQRVVDEARERSIRMVYQSHCVSIVETLEDSVPVLRVADWHNVGITICESANRMSSGQDDGAAGIGMIEFGLLNDYVQNHRFGPEENKAVLWWKRGKVSLEQIVLWGGGEIDSIEVFRTLRNVGYRDYVNLHQGVVGVMSPATAARQLHEFLKSLVDGRSA